jgi:hypothetical protein
MRTTVFVTMLACTVCMASHALAKKFESQWPKVIDNDKGKVVIYQPQLESFNDVSLVARSAVSVTPPKREPIFGAVWFAATVSVDKEDRVVKLEKTIVTDAKFPDAPAESIAELKKIIEEEIPEWGDELSYDELVTGMAAMEREQQVSEKLKNDAPEIIYRTKPTVLVFIDGQPILRDADEKIKYVANTPFFIVQRGSDWYLKGAETWYSADNALGPWKAMRDLPPKSVTDLADKSISKAPDEGVQQPADKSDKKVVPEIVVRTKPAEVIQTDGEPAYEPIKGTDLLYVKNSDDNIIMDIGTQLHYVLIAGRWYASKTLAEGTWGFVPGEKLPVEFRNIPEDSDLGVAVRASIPGTTEAKEAMMENQIPTTAAVDRKTATVSVTYDGSPKFEPITGTSMSYAVNTDKSVLLIGGRYYCCDQAIWFESDSPMGPWVVSSAVPPDVKDIPPDSPVYNVKYVYIYDSTPEVVYVGYTPAYTGSYPYGGCVVYGTGYYYAPWYGAYYYPRPVTFGFGVHYSPYGGWGMSFGVSYGWFTMSFGGYHGGYWGAGGYHAGYHHGYRHGYAAGYRHGQNAGNRPQPKANNIYKGRGEGVRASGARPSQQPAGGRQSAGARPSQQPNNVYADKNGNTYRKQGDNWQQRGKDGWNNTNRPSQTDLNRQSQARDRSVQRSQNYSRPQSRPAGRSGGGGRRR